MGVLFIAVAGIAASCTLLSTTWIAFSLKFIPNVPEKLPIFFFIGVFHISMHIFFITANLALYVLRIYILLFPLRPMRRANKLVACVEVAFALTAVSIAVGPSLMQGPSRTTPIQEDCFAMNCAGMFNRRQYVSSVIFTLSVGILLLGAAFLVSYFKYTKSINIGKTETLRMTKFVRYSLYFRIILETGPYMADLIAHEVGFKIGTYLGAYGLVEMGFITKAECILRKMKARANRRSFTHDAVTFAKAGPHAKVDLNGNELKLPEEDSIGQLSENNSVISSLHSSDIISDISLDGEESYSADISSGQLHLAAQFLNSKNHEGPHLSSPYAVLIAYLKENSIRIEELCRLLRADVTKEDVQKYCSNVSEAISSVFQSDRTGVSMVCSWIKPFDPEATVYKDFWGADGQITKIQMMHEEYTFPYYKDRNFQILRMNYARKDVSMYIALPRTKQSTIPEITGSYLEDVLKSEFRTDLNVKASIPKFEVVNVQDMNKCLEGIEHSNGAKQHDLDRCIQNIHFSVTETGTVSTRSPMAKENKSEVRFYTVDEVEFTADHPFAYFVVHEPSKAVLFSGLYV
ncbi:hypothetical protein QR680_015244 [Steinernema hermaphroditum]|uniref:Serpin domain-containing protein n=1 Tax=Steinernema hermaphroditum TaxID=289476 RepID=A0AA39H7A0_9BILA|nr:hypothetical protein QR680_015244 [Steinernema hermaphroditum]